jgi:predicted transport protein
VITKSVTGSQSPLAGLTHHRAHLALTVGPAFPPFGRTPGPPGAADAPATRPVAGPKRPASSKTVSEYLESAPETLRDLYAQLDSYIEALGDDVTKRTLKLYFAYRRLKNFACVEVHPQSHALLVYLKVDPSAVDLEAGFTRDLRTIGHFGTGDLEVRVTDAAQLTRALPLVLSSYALS